MILFLSIIGAGANLALANVLDPSVMKIAFPN
jgi:cyanate permease